MDESRTATVLEPLNDNQFTNRNYSDGDFEIQGAEAKFRFREFFRNFRQGQIYVYRDALVRQWNRKEYYVDVDLAHVNEYDDVLYNNLQSKPDTFLPFFEKGAKEALKMFLVNRDNTANELPDFQVVLRSSQIAHSLRNLNADLVNKLVKVPGIVISCTKARAKAIMVTLRCTNCGDVQHVDNRGPASMLSIPAKCVANVSQGGEECGLNTYKVMADSCKFIDQQTLKLQEAPEVVPTGEMPRHIALSVERYLVDKCAPGTRVSVMGISSMQSKTDDKKNGKFSSHVKTPYLRVVGIHIDTEGSGRVGTMYTPQEEEEMQRLARDPDIYNKVASSIAPQISSDNTSDIKKAIACLLMGGSRKILPDNVKLRGDINVLLMGDPSTAKSQILKFVERVAPIGVYTSGKGSSAAGLTASVIRDSKGEFYLEGGAMVLADGGVICIDEFDKMRENDRVAIHEAMEQQTISIAKAGITTVLNSRASVLAAANPIFGRYDDTKGIDENIDLMGTILSRFDCIFIVRDVRDQERDKKIARHVLGVHINAATESASGIQPDIDAATLKKFVSYCRDRCAPRLNDEAAAMLSGQYVHIRSGLRQSIQDNAGEASVIPITVRQLEALIRMSESLAKMRLSAEASVTDVQEAIRLFKVSTLAASQASPMLMSASGGEDVRRAEEFLKRRMGLRQTLNAKRVIEEAQGQGYKAEAVQRAIAAMIMRSELMEHGGRKLLKRIR